MLIVYGNIIKVTTIRLLLLWRDFLMILTNYESMFSDHVVMSGRLKLTQLCIGIGCPTFLNQIDSHHVINCQKYTQFGKKCLSFFLPHCSSKFQPNQTHREVAQKSMTIRYSPTVCICLIKSIKKYHFIFFII